MNIPRKQHDYLKSLLVNSGSPHDVILLEGARQVGKTTLIRGVLEDFQEVIEVNLEDNNLLATEIDQTSSFDDFRQLLEHSLGFDETKEQILFIDEAQESETLGSYVRFMKERWKNTRCILSGSSMKRLFKKRAPVGRVFVLKLNPLSFYEFLKAHKKDTLCEIIDSFLEKEAISPLFHEKFLKECDHFLKIGGLPEVVSTEIDNKDYGIKRSSIIKLQEDDFLRKEIFKKQYLFREALRGVANYLGSPSKLTHISENTYDAKQILSVMKAWHLILELEQRSFTSTSSFHPKRYVYDIGIAQEVRNLPLPSLSILNTRDNALRTQLGGLIENMVLLSLLDHKLGNIELSSWRKGSGSKPEVDFVLRHKALVPIECKASMRISQRTFSSVRQFLNETSTSVGFVVSAAPYSILREQDNVLINLPIYLCDSNIVIALADKYSR